MYTPYEGPKLANQKNRKSGVFDRKYGGSHSQFHRYFYINIGENNPTLLEGSLTYLLN